MVTKSIGNQISPMVQQFWDPEVDDRVQCINVHDETHDVKSFTFVSETMKYFAFQSGQYFMFELDIDGENHGRCYSVSSSPLRMNAFTVTVKRVADGKISNWLHDNLEPGMSLRASGPHGGFVRPSAPKFLLLSGGSGITPVMSMAREMADLTRAVDVVFLHAGRTPKDLIFRRELANIAERLKGFRHILLPEHAGCENSWPGLTGRITREFLSLAVPDLAERVVMCCGPAPFMRAAKAFSLQLGVPEANYREESFDAAVFEDAPAAVEEGDEAKSFKVAFTKQNKTIDVRADQTVMSIARKAGIRIPSSCANGICGTCKSKLVSGAVDMKHDGGIRQREIDAGLFLPCCSKPLADLVIDR